MSVILKCREKRRQRRGDEGRYRVGAALFASPWDVSWARAHPDLWIEYPYLNFRIPVHMERGVFRIVGARHVLVGSHDDPGVWLVVAKTSPYAWARDRVRHPRHFTSLDGIPWEIHAIDDFAARNAAKAAYLRTL